MVRELYFNKKRFLKSNYSCSKYLINDSDYVSILRNVLFIAQTGFL